MAQLELMRLVTSNMGAADGGFQGSCGNASVAIDFDNMGRDFITQGIDAHDHLLSSTGSSDCFLAATNEV